jgi:hypothetical protein
MEAMRKALIVDRSSVQRIFGSRLSNSFNEACSTMQADIIVTSAALAASEYTSSTTCLSQLDLFAVRNVSDSMTRSAAGSDVPQIFLHNNGTVSAFYERGSLQVVVANAGTCTASATLAKVPSLEWLRRPDGSEFAVAYDLTQKKIPTVLLTDDGPLRRIARSNTIEVHGSAWMLAYMAHLNILSWSRASSMYRRWAKDRRAVPLGVVTKNPIPLRDILEAVQAEVKQKCSFWAPM